MRCFICLLLSASVVFNAAAQGDLKWSSDGNSYYTAERGEIAAYSLPDFQRTTLVTSEELTPKGKVSALRVRDFSFADNGKLLLIYTNSKRVWRQDTRGDYWVLNRSTKTLRQIGARFPESSLMFAKFSPDGKKVAYVSEDNLYVEDVASGAITALTKGGNRQLINGTFDWAYEEEFDCRDGFRWSPDSKKIAYWQIDASKVKTYLMLNTTDSIYPFTVPVEYPVAGEAPSPFRIGVTTIDNPKTVWMQIPTDPKLQSYVPRMEWADNSSELIVQHLNRKQDVSDLLLCNAASGSIRTVLHETDPAWIDAAPSLSDNFWLNNGKDFLWSSDKDGWTHLYRVSRDGKQETLITKGNYDVMGLLAVTEKEGYAYFYASPDNATQRYLYRVKLDGGSQQPERVSPVNQQGTHTYRLSPDARYAQHSFSNHFTPSAREWVNLPDHSALGPDRVNQAVAKANPSHAGVSFFQVTTAEGVTMDGWMAKPKNFDSTKKYPVVFYVYTEPAGQNAKDVYGAGNNWLYKGNMADDGYIYITMDNRGTPAPKGREWRKCIYRKIGRLNIRDQALAAAELLKRPYMDTSRVAVWGWSGGGSATLDLLFQYPKIYKTGIAIAAVGYQLTYDNIYQERYMGLPQENKEDFILGSPVTYAKNLQGHLLYIHGTGDDNVHYTNAERLINELVAHGKQFQLMSYPNRTHGIFEGEGTTAHLQALYTDYLRQYCPPGAR